MKYTKEQLQKMMDEGGSLDLSGTGITSLPDGLTVGGSLYLSGTGITSLPDGLTVGGWLDLRGTGITDTARRLQNGDYVPGKYLYADGILTHIKGSKTIGEYTYYIGKIKGKSAITDGVNYAHCRNFRECIVMYRIITGACMAGTMAFVDSLHEVKEQYTVREIIEMTKGAYGGDTFRSFFENRNN